MRDQTKRTMSAWSQLRLLMLLCSLARPTSQNLLQRPVPSTLPTAPPAKD
jgi:hypothetical protein